MPVRTLQPSVPGSGLFYRRHSSIAEEAPSRPTTTPPLPRTRGNSFKRLSLSLSRTNDEPFPAFLTHEAEELPPQRPSTQPGAAADNVEQPKSASTPTASSSKKNVEGQRSEPQDDLGDLPLPRPQRLSLLGMRHASDPQLSTRFRKQERNAPKDVARKH